MKDFADNAYEDLKSFERGLSIIVVAIIFFTIGIIIGCWYERNYTQTPIERNEIIDSLTTVNDSIKIKVEKLDSIKNAKVIEVITLDNDSTLKLFYELVSE